ncbi:MAG: sialidase family protein, partial [Candidatus Dormibacteria bacterium]
MQHQATARRIARVAAVVIGGAAVAWTTTTGLASGTASVTPAGTQSFTIYTPPNGTPGQHSADEPSIGADWNTGAIMYLANTTTLRVNFDDTQPGSPATWTDVSAPATKVTSFDPILFTDPVTGRTVVSQLDLLCSLSEVTPDDGATWLPSNGCAQNGSEDHQSVGGGPFHTPVPTLPSPAYPHAVYYCNQDGGALVIGGSTAAYCGLSLNGGVTYQPGVPIYSFAQCGGLHGHIRVGPDGTAIVPNQSCDPTATCMNPVSLCIPFHNQAAVVSTNNGTTWSVNVLPKSHSTLRSDPAVATDSAGKWYFAYEDAVGLDQSTGLQTGGLAMISTSSDNGTTWSDPVDVGAPFNVKNVTFPEVIGGGPGRAAYAFLG